MAGWLRHSPRLLAEGRADSRLDDVGLALATAAQTRRRWSYVNVLGIKVGYQQPPTHANARQRDRQKPQFKRLSAA